MTPGTLWVNGQTTSTAAPRSFNNDLNLFFWGIAAEVQQAADSWLPFIDKIRLAQPQIDVYRFLANRPVSGRGLQCGLIDIPRKVVSRRNLSRLNVALLTRRGELVWQTEGSYTPERGGDLYAAIVEAQLIFGSRVAPKPKRLNFASSYPIGR